MSVSIVVVDSQRLFREGMRQLLETQESFEVIGEAADGPKALEVLREKRPDIVLIDVQLPRLSGIELVRSLREEGIRSAAILLSAHQGPAHVRQSLVAGAQGFLPKDSSAKDLIDAVYTVQQGRSYLAPGVADQVVTALTSKRDSGAGAAAELTARQRQVLQLIAEGLSTKEIAGELGISLKTAQTHRAKLMGRVGVRKASGLVRYAIREGIVSA